jgi:glycosyltransferase involved in cell wall biosynthesis
VRVLYDVTPLGNGAEPGPGRTGIFRAVQGFVDEVVRRAELDSTLAALSSWYGEVQLERYAAGASDGVASRMVTAWHNTAATHAQGRDLVDRAVAAGEHSPVGRRALTELAFLEKAARPLPVDGDFDVYHSFRPGLADASRVTAATRVLMVHDVIPLLFPELFDRDHTTAMRTILATLGPEDLIVVNSTCTRDDVCEHLDIEPTLVAIVPLAADRNVFHRIDDEATVTAVRRRHGLGDAPYILSVATLEPRKNIESLVRAFFALVDAGEAGELRLALVGRRGGRPRDWVHRSARTHAVPSS